MEQIVRRLTWFDRFNLYLLPTPKGLILVDSALPGMFGWLVKSLREVGVAPEQLAGVVVTHFHIDHVGTALALQRRGVPMYALQQEIPILLGEVPHPGYSGVAGQIMLAAERFIFGRLVFEAIEPLEPGQKLFDSAWRVVAAPGHTPGSLALFNEDSGDLLSGDTLVNNFGCPSANHPLFAADYPMAMQSALNLLKLEPKRIHPGHGKPLPLSAYFKVQEHLVRKLSRVGI
jgi:glyoxylase-like metal-dependent hydrolase (beta-lactamase superfamily II)